ncbi:hypothetical protein HMPREF9449_01680 [Odoribacter laneus YIT 12061]|uniref:Uncharacterized protein n=1 Tax=Odoribacter laneus YIT 12061 TaxID=742817 RepID=H1DHE4_9BACT|nr:hypothetical protein HMPREF9449_01680 [Odoribacter laneus YIT 12061]
MYFSKQTSPKGNNAPEGRTFLAKKTNYPYHKPFLNFPEKIMQKLHIKARP